jgi:hypothetical protein
LSDNENSKWGAKIVSEIQVCKEIKCPYFVPTSKKSYGCQRYSVASHCHLGHKRPYFQSQKGSSGYELEMNEGDFSLDELKAENDAFFSKPEEQERIEFDKWLKKDN